VLANLKCSAKLSFQKTQDLTEVRAGIAFRASVVSPNEIVKLSKVIDQSPVSNLFVNDSYQGFDCLDICSAALGVSKGLSIGSGVIRLLEHDEQLLLRRITTLQELSGNRFVLGVGTGRPSPNPVERINQLLERIASLKNNFQKGGGAVFPKVFIATLKRGIARKVAGKSDGILLNFCSPDYAKSLIASYKQSFAGSAEFGCYLKVFYSKSKANANRLLIEEFKGYAQLPQYRKMFESDHALKAIEEPLRLSSGEVPQPLLRISVANPSTLELREYVSRFREAGVTLPCIYPYFASQDGFEFKSEIIRSIIEATA
jgi:hypothetical protein